MEKLFVERFMGNKPQLEKLLRAEHPGSYLALVRMVVQVITSVDYHDIDPALVHEVEDGDYQGTLVYVIGAKGYQPSDYWYVRVYYGSCSGCDTLEAIRSENYFDSPNESQVSQYMGLALNIVQGLTKMGGRTGMKCTCCGEEADSVLETLASGLTFTCQECADLFFMWIISQGRTENECTSWN